MATITLVIIVTPYFAIVLVPLSYVYYKALIYYIATSREVKRIESIARSPIYSTFGETLNGTTLIRAFKMQNNFVDKNSLQLNDNQTAYFAGTSANRWLAVRLEFVGAGIVLSAALFAVMERGTINPSLAGLSVSYALGVTQRLCWIVRMGGQCETQVTLGAALRCLGCAVIVLGLLSICSCALLI